VTPSSCPPFILAAAFAASSSEPNRTKAAPVCVFDAASQQMVTSSTVPKFAKISSRWPACTFRVSGLISTRTGGPAGTSSAASCLRAGERLRLRERERDRERLRERASLPTLSATSRSRETLRDRAAGLGERERLRERDGERDRDPAIVGLSADSSPFSEKERRGKNKGEKRTEKEDKEQEEEGERRGKNPRVRSRPKISNRPLGSFPFF
jgi:hypothetical protein